jgi:hypothetical protein
MGMEALEIITGLAQIIAWLVIVFIVACWAVRVLVALERIVELLEGAIEEHTPKDN